jgi:hypothetical protein
MDRLMNATKLGRFSWFERWWDLTAALPPAVAYRQDKPVSETFSALQIAVHIQENEHCRFSRLYSKNVLLSEVTTVDFFAWFACCTGYDYPSGPPELMFTWKDALLKLEHARIKKRERQAFSVHEGGYRAAS